MLVPLSALADPPLTVSRAEKDRARTLFDRANKMYKRGQYEEALKLYRDAGAIYPSYKIELNIGETLESLGRNTEAATTYHQFLRKFKDAPVSARREAWLRMDGMRRWLGRVKLHCDEEGAQVSLDDKAVGVTPLESSIYFQPGTHTIKVEKEGFQPVTRKLRIRRGGALHLRVKLKDEATAAQATKMVGAKEAAAKETAAKEAAVRASCPLNANDEAVHKARQKMTIAGFVAMGTSLVLVTSAAVLYGVGGAQGSEANDAYLAATTHGAMALHYDEVQDAKTKIYVAHGLLAAGLVAAGLSIFQFVARPDLPADAEVALAPLVGGAAFSVGGRF